MHRFGGIGEVLVKGLGLGFGRREREFPAFAQKQMSAFGGMLSFQVKGGKERAIQVASRVKIFTNATSLGGVESLLELRATSEGPNSTLPQNLIRVSVGLEAVEDLIADLEQCLDRL